MIDAGELRRGNVLRLDGKLFELLEFRHQKIGRGSAQVRLRMRDLKTGAITERVNQASQRYERVRLDQQPVQYLYEDPAGFHFLNMETYDEMILSQVDVGQVARYLVDSLELTIVLFEGLPLGLEPPITVDMPVTEAEPGVRGDTATGATKVAKLSTGLEVQVPLFVNVGDVIKVDTRSGAYLERSG